MHCGVDGVQVCWDEALQNTSLTPFHVNVEPERLRMFAQATGQEHPCFLDAASAHAAGYAGVVVPPTFLFCLGMLGPKPLEIYERLGVNYAHVLHGEQHFEYYRPVYSGQTLHFAPRIGRLQLKKQGVLRLFEWLQCITTPSGQAVADLCSVMVVHTPAACSQGGRDACNR